MFESYQTDEQYGQDLGLEAWESIQHLDTLPEDVARKIAESIPRNRLIVDTYKKGQAKYGQTIVFAVDVNHAIALNTQFRKAGIASDYVVSSIRDAATGVTISREDNERKEQAYRDGKLQVLINVNILTEGVDFPKTGTVFLARPTVSRWMFAESDRTPHCMVSDTAGKEVLERKRQISRLPSPAGPVPGRFDRLHRFVLESVPACLLTCMDGRDGHIC